MVEARYGLKKIRDRQSFCQNHRCEGYKLPSNKGFEGRHRVKVFHKTRGEIYLCEVCANVLYI